MMSAHRAEKEKVWYLRIENVLQGPYSSAMIRRLLHNGELTLADEVSLDRQNWSRVREIAELVPIKLRAEMGDRAAQTKLKTRQSVDRAEDKALQGIPVVASLIMLFIIVTAIGVGIWIGMPAQISEPDCEADAAPGVDWRYCVFNDLDPGAVSLAGANLNSTILRRARLTAINLRESDLRYADLHQADLSYAQLSHAHLQGANLTDADLSQADLTGADLRYADLTACRMSGVNLTEARLDGAIWTDGKVCADGSVGRCLP